MKDHHLFLIFLGLALSCVLVYGIFSANQNEVITPTPGMNESAEVPSHPTSTSTMVADSFPTATDKPAPENLEATQPPPPFDQFGIYWYSGFETGNLQEWEEKNGEFIRQGTSPYYQIVNQPVLDGNFSNALTIDTSLDSNNQAAYLFLYDNPDEAWYSSWYYIPEDTHGFIWWIIMQWKSTNNGNSDESLPLWVLNLEQIPLQDDLQLSLIYRPDSDADKIVYTNYAFTVPRGEWFHISTYLKKSNNNDGAISVWLNGQELTTLTGIHTTLRDNTLFFSISHYSNEIMPNPSTLYVDDIIISQERIPPEFRLP